MDTTDSRALEPSLIPQQRRPLPRPSGDPGEGRGLESWLDRALRSGQLPVAESVALLLWRHEGLSAAHASLARSLAASQQRALDPTSDPHESWRTVTTARAVLERLQAVTAPDGSRGRVLLATPVGDRHTLALTALAHQAQEAGFRALAVDDLPVAELAALAGERDVRAVVISAHLPWSAAAAHRTVTALRRRGPDLLVAIGGPGAPRAVRGCDLVTSDSDALGKALRRHGNRLSARETDVLGGVAAGRTTTQIASDLGVSPATVRSHLDQVFAKTQTTHRAAAVARALRNGWLD